MSVKNRGYRGPASLSKVSQQFGLLSLLKRKTARFLCLQTVLYEIDEEREREQFTLFHLNAIEKRFKNQ